MSEVSTVGVDLAKAVFHVHGADASGATVWSKPLKRSQLETFFAKLPSCVVAMEACGSAHYWARRLQGLGHQVRLIAPIYVKPFVARNKTDARDAAAICEAAQRPNLRTVAVKSQARQAQEGLHRVRDLLVRQRTQAANQIRGLAAEFGLVSRLGRAGLMELIGRIATEELPDAARLALHAAAAHHAQLDEHIARLEQEIGRQALADPDARRLMSIPGVGPIGASALVAAIADPKGFRSGRELAAWMGLTPRVEGTGGKARCGSISKRGDTHVRRLLVLGATARLAHARRTGKLDAWTSAMLARRPFRVVATALAARTARIVWALLVKGGLYDPNRRLTPA